VAGHADETPSAAADSECSPGKAVRQVSEATATSKYAPQISRHDT